MKRRRFPDAGAGGDTDSTKAWDPLLCVLCQRVTHKNDKETSPVSEENYDTLFEVCNANERQHLSNGVFHRGCFRNRQAQHAKQAKRSKTDESETTTHDFVVESARQLMIPGRVLTMKTLAEEINSNERPDNLMRRLQIARLPGLKFLTAPAPHPSIVYSGMNEYDLASQNIALQEENRALKEEIARRSHMEDIKKVADWCREKMDIRWVDMQHLGEQLQMTDDPVFLLVNLLLNGSESNADDARLHASRTISDLIYYNMIKSPKNSGNYSRHPKSRETASSLYIAWTLYCSFRCKELIEKFHNLGLCISYDRLMQIMNNLYNSAITRFSLEKVVCPSSLNRAVFTTGSFDNIDHKTMSTTARSEFHGTSVALTAHCTRENPGIERATVPYVETNVRELKPLSATFKNVIPSKPDTRGLLAPSHPAVEWSDTARPVDENRQQWLEMAHTVVITENPPEKLALSRSAFTSKTDEGNASALIPAQTGTFPLFRNKAATMAMSLHAMKIIAEATEFLHPGQMPVVAADCPLFAICKLIQWLPSSPYTETNYFVKLGDLHVEHVFQEIIGQLLEGTGWCEVLAMSGIYDTGRAEAVLRSHHITRARYIHQVNFLALVVLRTEAYVQAKTDMSMEEWSNVQGQTYPQFGFYQSILDMEQLLLDFVWSIRKGDFFPYVAYLHRISALCFALDHVNYARWLTVHVQDLMNLRHRDEYVFSKFAEGFFTTARSMARHSRIALDQNHEMQNGILKTSGGIIGLTEDERKLDKLLVAGPELASLVSKFEADIFGQSSEQEPHHEFSASFQNQMLVDVRALLASYRECGSPFTIQSSDLTVLDTGMVLPPEIWSAVRSMEPTGKAQRDAFISERLVTDRKKIGS